MLDSKKILKLDKRQSIVQRIDSMKSALAADSMKKKLGRYHYFGYSSQKLTDRIFERLPSNLNSNSRIGVVNDFGLEVISRLVEQGYNNVYILCTEENDKLYNIIKYMIEKEFQFNKERILKLQDIDMNDKFDLVIANPPYEIGNQVIAETMKHCEEAVVLMPASKYKKDSLYKVVTSFEVLPWHEYKECFGDADTHVHIATCKNNNESEYASWTEFELNTYDQKWIRYYRENLRRKASWECSYRVDAYHPCESTFLLTIRSCVDGVHKTKNCLDFHWNIEEICDYSKFPSSTGAQAVFTTFKSHQEKHNISSWWYKSLIASQLVRGINKQSLSETYSFLPKVDWTKTWTDEEILEDYGYTDEEIKEILK